MTVWTRLQIIAAMTAVTFAAAADIAIVPPRKPDKLVAEAAGELQKYLGQAMSTKAVVGRASTNDGLRVVLAVDRGLAKELTEEGFRMQSDGRTVRLTGAGPLAVRHAAYAFLEHLGCRWFFPGQAWEVVPKLEPVFPVIDQTSRPSYQRRSIWYGWGIGPIPENAVAYRDWVRKNRQGGLLTGGMGHSYAGIARPDLHFKDHPEWFPLIDGKRIAGGQLCLANADIRQRAIDRALKYFKAHPDIRMISMSPNDGAGWCQCPYCAELGSVTDQALWLANQVADAVRPKFPGRMIAMYAYAGTSPPPNIKAASNVIIFIATAFNQFGFEKGLEGWSKRAAKIGIRDYYNVIIWHREMPRWQIDKMRQRLPEMHRKGAIAISAESGNQWAPEGLNYYVAAKLMWDTSIDVDKLLDDFYDKCWGPAAKPMRRYYERFRGGSRMTSRTLALALHDLEEASALAKAPAIVARLDMIKVYLHWVRLYFIHNTAPSAKARLQATQNAHHYAWRVRKTNMIHSYAQFRERRIWRAGNIPLYELERWKLTDQPPEFDLTPTPDIPAADDDNQAELLTALTEQKDDVDLTDQLDEPENDEPITPPMYTHAEIEAMFRVDLEACGKPFEVAARQYSTDLLPLPPNTPGAADPKTPAAPRFRSTNSFLFRSNGVFPVQLRPGHVRRRTGAYELFAVDAPEKALAGGAVEGAEPYVLELKAPANTVCRLRFSLGGMAANVQSKADPLVWQLQQGQNSHVIGGTGRQYFFVPPGTAAFALGLHTPDGYGKVVIFDPAGKVRFEQGGNYAPGEEFGIVVPPDMAGAVWSFTVGRGEDMAGIYLLGVPPYAAPRPSQLLVPREALGGNLK